MIHKVLAAPFFIMTLFLTASLAVTRKDRTYPADNAPWCAVFSVGNGDYWDCRYATIEACREQAIAGNRGYCNNNPRVPVDGQNPKRRQSRQPG
jgi:hypothetical protein